MSEVKDPTFLFATRFSSSNPFKGYSTPFWVVTNGLFIWFASSHLIWEEDNFCKNIDAPKDHQLDAYLSSHISRECFFPYKNFHERKIFSVQSEKLVSWQTSVYRCNWVSNSQQVEIVVEVTRWWIVNRIIFGNFSFTHTQFLTWFTDAELNISKVVLFPYCCVEHSFGEWKRNTRATYGQSRASSSQWFDRWTNMCVPMYIHL